MYNNSPYLGQGYQVPRFQAMEQPVYQTQNYLKGKQVDSIDVVRAADVPFDGSISYFPLTDGSAIVTKQLQIDGTSKISVFKPITEAKEEVKYITTKDLETTLSEWKDKELEEIKDSIKELEKKIKKTKES